MERVDVLEAGEAVDGGRQALGEGLGCILDFAGVEGADTADLEAGTDLGRKTSLAAELLAPRPAAAERRVRMRTFGRGQCPETPGSWEPRGCLSTASSWRIWCEVGGVEEQCRRLAGRLYWDGGELDIFQNFDGASLGAGLRFCRMVRAQSPAPHFQTSQACTLPSTPLTS